MYQEYSRAVRAVLFECFDIAETAVLVYRSILVELFPLRFSNMAYLRHELNVHLNALSGVLHLLVRLRNVFRVRQRSAYSSDTLHHPIES